MAKRVRRTKAEIEASKGLGDTVEKVFKATGIDKIAKFILGDDCKCDERKEKLNKLSTTINRLSETPMLLDFI